YWPGRMGVSVTRPVNSPPSGPASTVSFGPGAFLFSISSRPCMKSLTAALRPHVTVERFLGDVTTGLLDEVAAQFGEVRAICAGHVLELGDLIDGEVLVEHVGG